MSPFFILCLGISGFSPSVIFLKAFVISRRDRSMWNVQADKKLDAKVQNITLKSLIIKFITMASED